MDRALPAVPFREAVVTREVALASERIGLPQRDPVDRLLAGTAAVYELTLVTADERLLSASGFQVLPNR